MLKSLIKILMLVIIITGLLSAQKISSEQQNLSQMTGKWLAKKAVLMIDGKSYSGEYSLESLPVNMNTGLLVHEKFSNDELGSMIGEDLLGFDPNQKQIHLYSIDNTGTCHDHYGYWIDNKHLFVQYQGVVEGKMFVEQIHILNETPEKMRLKLTGMLNGDIFEEADVTFIKMGETASK